MIGGIVQRGFAGIRVGWLAVGAIVAAGVLLTFLPGSAPAAVTPKPAWKLLGATGPTNLPPEQSEVQRATVEASGGQFTLSQTATAQGAARTGTATIAVVKGSSEATLVSGHFEEGQTFVLSFLWFFGRVEVESCSPDCATAGATLNLSKAARSDGTVEVKDLLYRELELSDVEGAFVEGAPIAGRTIGEKEEEILPAGTVITSPLAGGIVRVSNFPTAAGPAAVTSTETTVGLPFNAPAATVQGALEGLRQVGAGAVTVSGGPGGEAAHPYVIKFGGPLADQNVPQLGADSSGLEGENAYVHMFTTVPGGPGTGELVVAPVNIGGKATEGEVTLEVGPLPSGVVVGGKVHEGENLGEWACGAAGQTAASCHMSTRIGALRSTNTVVVPLRVEGAVAPGATVRVAVSGGGGGSAEEYVPIVVSERDAEPGIQAMSVGPFEADGTPSTQAGAHPYSDLAFFLLNTVRTGSGEIAPAGDLRQVNVDLPPGFLGDPLAIARCPQELTIPHPAEPGPLCGAAERIGRLTPVITRFGLLNRLLAADIYNDVPGRGAAAEFTSQIGLPTQSLLGSVRSEDDFGIRVIAPRVATYFRVYGSLAVLEGEPVGSPGVAWFRNPTDCAEQAREAPVETLTVSSWQRPTTFVPTTQALPPVTGCDKLHFEPKFSLQPTSTQASSGVGATAHLHIDQSNIAKPHTLATPDLKQSVVTLPRGLNVNPSQANGLEACSEAQVGYKGEGPLPNPTRFNEAPVTCPDGSKLGTVEATSPLLEEPLKGTIYLAEQEKNPFDSLIALYLVFESERFGVTLKLPGKVDTNSETGQITATFDYVPQQPIEDLTLHFRGGGPRSEFATPEVCGTYTTTGKWTPWSAPESGPPARTSDSFTISGNCASSAATRPFHPSFEGGSVDPLAGAYSPLVIKVNRHDGEQELRSLDFTLPPGETGRLAGIPYCPEDAIAAAAGKTGREEQSSPSCPSASQIGTVDAAAGVGSAPFHVGGKVYLAGPYKGAPLSAVVVTPAVAGPFDLGDVVIRSPLYVDLETAQITAKSDPIPTILRGIPLKIRSVAITIDRSGFTLNPTDCEAMSISATVGSSNGATASPTNRFQVGGCKKLRFKPKLSLSLKGATKRTGHPALKAVVTYPVYSGTGCATPARRAHRLSRKAKKERQRAGRLSGGRASRRLRRQARRHARQARKLRAEAKQCLREGPPREANIARAQVGLPHSEFLDQGNLNKVCKQADLRAATCPKSSVYGHAKAWTPLLDKPLQGPVYLGVGFGYKLPALVADLNGQIRILLVGRIDTTKHNGIRNTFEVVPDAPVSRFVLTMKGGKKYGLLENSENICKKTQQASALFNAQNGLRLHMQPKIRNSCKGKKGKKKSRRRQVHRGR